MAWFPFLSRSAHNEIVEMYRVQLQKCDLERRQLLDYICRAQGRGLFEELNHPTPIKEVTDPHYIGQRRPSARKFVRDIQEAIDQQYRDAESAPSEARQVIASTLQEGAAAAKGGKE